VVEQVGDGVGDAFAAAADVVGAGLAGGGVEVGADLRPGDRADA
jgi:hypothetical protein